MLWANITASGLSASRHKLRLTWEPSLYDTGRTNCFYGTDGVEKYLFPWYARMSWERILLFQCQSLSLLVNDSQIAESTPAEFLSKPVLHEKSLLTKTNFRALFPVIPVAVFLNLKQPQCWTRLSTYHKVVLIMCPLKSMKRKKSKRLHWIPSSWILYLSGSHKGW